MREIPSLQTLCLRSIGSHACSVEATFAKSQTGEPSTASRLLRSFHERPPSFSSVSGKSQQQQQQLPTKPQQKKQNQSTISCIPMARTPCIGPGSARRVQANEIDLHHPLVACYHSSSTASGSNDAAAVANRIFFMYHGNAALDCLQSYIDSLVEMGRMDDCRLGRHFWDEWKMAIVLAHEASQQQQTGDTGSSSEKDVVEEEVQQPIAKRPRRQQQKQQQQQQKQDSSLFSESSPTSLGALSLHNCVIGDETLEHMRDASIGPNLATLDLTGVRGLTDELMMDVLLPNCRNLIYLSLKNCRRITSKVCSPDRGLAKYQKKLQFIDLGGAFNISCRSVLDCLVPNLTALTQLHASGLGWSDATLDELAQTKKKMCASNDSTSKNWTALSLSFSANITHAALRQSLSVVAGSLTSLAVAFCESVIDNAAMGLLGRNLPLVVSLDVRGNHQLSTLTGWYDGRVSADLPPQKLVVLGRYSGLTDNSVEETKRVHPLEATDLVVILDGGGMGAGITRTEEVVVEDDQDE